METRRLPRNAAATVIGQTRGTKLVDQIAQLQGPLNNAWRAASKAKDAAKDAHATACQPVAIQFEIRPMAN